MSHGTGLHRSAPEKVAHRVGAELHADIAAALAAGPVGSADLTSWLSDAVHFDQGESECCAEHSFCTGIVGAMNKTGAPLPFVPSPQLLASCTYSDLRAAATPVNDTLPILKDTGAQLQDVANAANKWGIGQIGPLVDGRNSDVPNDPPDGSFPEAEPWRVVIAGQRLVAGEYSIAINAQTPKLVAASLDAGFFVWCGFFCDSRFQALRPGQVAGAPDLNDPAGGGHAVLLCGYRIVGGKIQARLWNSWGRAWCEDGCVWVDEDFLVAMWDAWPFTARMVLP